ncbi:MAG: TolC family protein [Chitinophagales bacterium]
MLLLLCFSSKSQQLLTLEDAVKIALQNNYDIRLSSNNLEIDEKNVSAGNAGMLPNINAGLTNVNSIQNSSQTQSDGNVIERNGAKNFNLNYGVELDWTIFDGFKMFAKLDQLKEIQKLGEAELKITVLNKVSDVMTTYYDLVQQQQQLRAFDTTLYISQMRYNLALNRFTIGKASKLEVLNASVDKNSDTTNLLRQMDMFSNTKKMLNELLARDPDTPFTIMDTITVDRTLKLEELNILALQQNPALQAALINKRIAELDLRQLKGERYPIIGVNTGYNFNRSETPLGFATKSSAQGFTYGVTASVNLFNGFLQNRNEKIAGIVIDNADLQLQQLNQSIRTQLSAAYQTYLTNLSLIDLEEKNQAIARQNLELTIDKFRLGSIAAIEFRDAQLNFVIARVRYSNAQYQAKLSEISLKEIAGNLVI